MTHRISTPRGDAEVDLDIPPEPALLLVLGHGAGGSVRSPDLVAIRDAAVAAGYAVARVTQPYRVAGRRAPAPAAHLDEAWLAVLAGLDALAPEAGLASLPLVTGGRSSGARVACRTAKAVGAAGVLALAFPLHPPGRPDRTRADELVAAGVPVLVINGDRDPFGVPEPRRRVTVHVVPGANHSLRTAPANLTTPALAWLKKVRRRPRR
ncbi:MAG: alpha/beta family hydrolase [Mycobacteriales bacterium]